MTGAAPDLPLLAVPLHPDALGWRVQNSGLKNGGDPWARIVPYVRSRDVMDRLDDVCGPHGWANEYRPGPAGGVLCGISVYTGGEWVTKWDGADNTDVEAVKGGLSNAMKRAGAQWGIGRYLARLDSGWAVFADQGRYHCRIPKDGKWFDWNPPRLPAWALPARQQQQRGAA